MLVIAIVLFMMIRAESMGAPLMFTAAGIVIIIVIAISVVRALLRL